jgi:hypothetical protein
LAQGLVEVGSQENPDVAVIFVPVSPAKATEAIVIAIKSKICNTCGLIIVMIIT